MKKRVYTFYILFTLTALAVADVKYVSTTTMDFEGTTGAMMKFFGAGKPIKSADYYQDHLKRTDTFDKKDKVETSQLVDLNKELFVTINHKDKEYSQMTFAEWKELMQSTMEKLGQEEYGEAEAKDEPKAEVDWELKVDVKETGEKANIAGKNTDKVIITLDLDAKVTSTEVKAGEEPESAKGGMIVTSANWLYNGEDKAKKEMDEFNQRLVEKLGFVGGSGSAKEMMAKIVEQNSQLGEAIEAMQKEGKKLQGVSLRNETLYETKIDPETAKKIEEEKAKQDNEESAEIPTSVGGLVGGFGKKMVKKHMEKKDEGVKERSTLMKSTTEVLEFDTASLSASLFEIPSGYKLVEQKTEE